MDDNSIMPWGRFKGEKMANVPAFYLKWLLDNDKCSGEVKQYIENNLDVIKSQIRKKAIETSYNKQQFKNKTK